MQSLDKTTIIVLAKLNENYFDRRKQSIHYPVRQKLEFNALKRCFNANRSLKRRFNEFQTGINALRYKRVYCLI